MADSYEKAAVTRSTHVTYILFGGTELCFEHNDYSIEHREKKKCTYYLYMETYYTVAPSPAL